MDLLSVSYLSSCTIDFGPDDLREMNLRSSANNEYLGITGVLFFSDGLFFQTLEGAAQDVRPLVKKIAVDNRHERMNILAETQISQRVFPFWTMRYFDKSLTERFPEASLDKLRQQDEFVHRLHQIFLRDQAAGRELHSD